MNDEVLRRFLRWITVEANGCWRFGSTEAKGYGRLWVRGKHVKAHRLSYEFFRSPIPDGLQLDHLCRNRACVNPDHLEVVTNRENVLRGIGITARHAQQTHCTNGHEFTPENTYVRPKGQRACIRCRNEDNRRYRRRISEATRETVASS